MLYGNGVVNVVNYATFIPLFRESGFVEDLKLVACKFGRAQNFKYKWWH